jgi:hypothetical protein
VSVTANYSWGVLNGNKRSDCIDFISQAIARLPSLKKKLVLVMMAGDE